MSIDPPIPSPPSPRSLYARVWRWHFYAGLYVAPFMVMLSLTGLVMLSSDAIDGRLYADRLFVPTPGPATVSLQAQVEATARAFPDRTITSITPAVDATRTTQVLTSEAGAIVAVYVDPTSGHVLGEIVDSQRPRVVATLIHGTLLVGRFGDWLIEIAAGLGVVLVISGVYLWWPRGAGWTQALRVARSPRRLLIRDLHGLGGLLLAPVFVFYLVTGLSWTEVWGGRFTQAWSTFPAEKAAPVGTAGNNSHASATHGDILNAPGRLTAPWGIEQTPMPVSVLARQHDTHDDHADHGAAAMPTITADEAVAISRAHGIGERYAVSLPQGATGVWTISATSMAGLITDPRDEVTVHIDQYSGDVRGLITWADYSLPAKGMAAGVPLHQGSFGAWNLWAAVVVCIAVLGLAATGVATWWLRRPSRAGTTGRPAVPARRTSASRGTRHGRRRRTRVPSGRPDLRGYRGARCARGAAAAGTARRARLTSSGASAGREARRPSEPPTARY